MAQFYKPQLRATKPQRLTEQQVVGLDHQGRGIIRTATGVRFVPGALPTERVTITVQGKHDAQLERVQTTSKQRVTPLCAFYEQCGGCDLQHLALSAQREHKQQVVAEILAKFGQVEAQQWLEPLAGDAWHYRRRARLAVHYDAKRQQFKMGFRAPKSKRITVIDACVVLAENLNRLIPPLQLLLPQLELVKQLGHVELIEFEHQVVVLLRLREWPNESDQKQLQQFAAHYEVAVWCDTEQQLAPLTASNPLSYRTVGASINCSPTNFMQAHRQLSEKMVEQALTWLDIQPNDKILELYAGSGNFSLPMALAGAQVTAIEGVASMVEQLKANAHNAQLSIAAFCTDLEQPWSRQAWSQEQFTKVLLDPARAGAPQAIKEVATRQPQKIVYVSCAPDTLARDAKVLKDNGYTLKQAQVVDMFPQTHHIEVITLFERE
ncbi:23S rRNA (uracil(1939)-C(5))-methyltransferase RlmD [Pseudidiomarina marina]|uniref:23S rRNA (uracil(1939)-C(5))-methyltransferase RlmD n=1 Tax=Pseudidiomarina marina TaxID=502366 RepID=UPI00384F09CC